jgi:hypothetical protein
MNNEDTTYETRALHWIELIIEDSFNAEMDEQEFAACCTTLIYHLNAHIDAAKPPATPGDTSQVSIAEMASWLGVDSIDLLSR